MYKYKVDYRYGGIKSPPYPYIDAMVDERSL